jgi:hypothetical protein
MSYRFTVENGQFIGIPVEKPIGQEVKRRLYDIGTRFVFGKNGFAFIDESEVSFVNVVVV